MQPLAFILVAGIAVWLVVYLFITDGSAISATIMACAAMFAVLMLKIREREGMVQRFDPVRQSSITPRSGEPVNYETSATEAGTPFRPHPSEAYAKPFTLPTVSNPFMNVLPPNGGEYGNIPPAAPAFNRKVEKRINDAVIQDVAGIGMLSDDETTKDDATRSRLYADLGGEIDLADSLRVFNSTPATTMPNDQTGFAEFCYSDVGNCTRGGELFCLPVPKVRPGEAPVKRKGVDGPYKTSGQDVLIDPHAHRNGHDGLAFATTHARAAAAAHR